MNLSPEQKDVLAALYENGGTTTWNGILQGEQIGISYELQDLGLVTVGSTQYHGNMRVSLTREGKRWGKALSRAGFKSTYSPVTD